MPTLEWIGKEKVINHHQDVPFRVLEKKYTYNADTSENMIIHGDNLLALKSLLPQYEGMIDCIYIDPPYNTGNEKWVYNDNVNDPKIKKWLGEVVGTEGEDLSRHDKWLCMMYPRLKLLYKLMANDGYIFISINYENESAFLRCICDEIFGRTNFIGELTWESTTQPSNAGSALFGLQQKVEPILLYIKNKKYYNGFLLKELTTKKEYPHIGKFGACRFEIIEKSDAGGYGRPSMKFSILGQFPREGKRWQIGEETAHALEATGRLEIIDGIVKKAVYPEDEEDKKSYIPFWSHLSAAEVGTAQKGKEQLNTVMNCAVGFDTVKPVELIISLLSHFKKNSIILDSFAGSGTTAHAVLNMNKQDGGNRKFILVEMMDYAETITAERVKRVIKGYGEGDKAVGGSGGDFTYYELGASIFKEDKNLNEEIGEEEIRKYVYYTETKQSVERNDCDCKYFLGKCADTSYYFYYEKDRMTTLNMEFLSTVKTQAEGYVIYADRCALSDELLREHGIVFKKIPRDISRF